MEGNLGHIMFTALLYYVEVLGQRRRRFNTIFIRVVFDYYTQCSFIKFEVTRILLFSIESPHNNFIICSRRYVTQLKHTGF